MGYAGGTVTQPIVGGFDELGKLMLQGLAQTNAIVMEQQRRRSSEMDKLSEMASKITATNIEDYDNVIRYGASSIADNLLQAQNDLKSGKINMAQYNTIKSKSYKNTAILANSSKLQDKLNKQVQKGVEDKRFDPLSLDFQNMLGFNDPNERKLIFKAYATDSTGNKKLDINNKPILIDRPANERMAIQFIGTDMYKVKYKEVQKLNEKGDPIFDKNGVPETETKQFIIKANEYLSPSLKKIDFFDLTQKVKDFQSIKGKRARYIDRNGAPVDAPYEELAHLKSGTKVYGYALSPQYFPDMIADVETDVKALSNDHMISILSNYTGARPEWSTDYQGPRSLKEVNSDDNIFFNINVGGESVKVPRFYNENGEVIKDFTFDPKVLQTGSDGTIHLTDEQKEVARSIYRRKLHNSFNVNYSEYKDFIDKKKDPNAATRLTDYNKSTYSKLNEDGKIDYKATIDSQYFGNQIAIIAAATQDVTGFDAANVAENLRIQHRSGKKIENIGQVSPEQKSLLDRRSDVIGGFEPLTFSKEVKSSDEIMKYVTQDLKGRTVTGKTLKNLSKVIVLDEGVDEKGDNQPIMVVLEGTVDVAKRAFSQGEPVIGGGQASLQLTGGVAANDFYVLNSSEMNSLYKRLWRQGDSPKSFRSILSKKGYDFDGRRKVKKTKDGKEIFVLEKAQPQAFKEYVQEINIMP